MRKFVFAACLIVLLCASTAAAQTHVRQGGPGEPPCARGDSNDPACLPGESMIGIGFNVGQSARVSIDNPPCDAQMSPLLVKGLRTLADSQTAGVASQGGWFDDLLPMFQGHLGGIGGTVGDILRRWDGNNKSACQMLGVLIPRGRTLTRIQVTLSTDNHPAGCRIYVVRKDQLIPTRCAVYPGHPPQFAHFAGYEAPVIRRSGRSTAVGVIFRNWSSDWIRTPYLRVYYK